MKLFETTLGRFLSDTARKQPDKEFIVYADRNLRFTYGELLKRVDNRAKGLLALGLEKGDHLGIWASNVPDRLTFMFATAAFGKPHLR